MFNDPRDPLVDSIVAGLDAWIIEDGNYRNFARNAKAAFALEFYAASPLEVFAAQYDPIPSLIRIRDAEYEVVGKVVHVADDWWAVDVGILAFREEVPPTNVRQGSWLRGQIFIGIDPFFYFERLAHQPGAPALVYDWKIERIEVQTAPLIEVKPRRFERDATKLGWKDISETNAWEEAGEYLLHCIRISGPRPPQGRRRP